MGTKVLRQNTDQKTKNFNELLKRLDKFNCIADDYVDLVRQEIELRKMEFEAGIRQAQSSIVRSSEMAEMLKKMMSFAMQTYVMNEKQRNEERDLLRGGKKNSNALSAKKQKKRKASE